MYFYRNIYKIPSVSKTKAVQSVIANYLKNIFLYMSMCMQNVRKEAEKLVE